jgi:hypothetical protein
MMLAELLVKFYSESPAACIVCEVGQSHYLCSVEG